MPDATEWVVTTDGRRPLGDVARELADAGFAVGQHLDAIGIVTGTATPQVAAAARRVPGVLDVSPNTPIDIGPPDAPVS